MPLRTFEPDDGQPLRLRVDDVRPVPSQIDAASALLSCTDSERTTVRVVVDAPADAGSPDWQPDQWYEFDTLSPATDSFRAELRFDPAANTHGETTPPETDAVGAGPDSPPPDAADGWVVRLGDRDDKLRFTVTAVPTGEQPVTPTAPDGFEITAVCLADETTAGDPAVYHREAADQHDERLLLEHAVADLAETAAETLLTWRDGPDPLALLAARTQHLADGETLPVDSADAITGHYYADLSRLGARLGQDDLVATARSLDVAAEYPQFGPDALGRTPTEWRADWSLDTTPLTGRTDTRLTERDYRTLAEPYLADDATERDALGTCLKRYASAPLSALQRLCAAEAAERLGCVRATTR